VDKEASGVTNLDNIDRHLADMEEGIGKLVSAAVENINAAFGDAKQQIVADVLHELQAQVAAASPTAVVVDALIGCLF
jgi:hypothetical protein